MGLKERLYSLWTEAKALNGDAVYSIFYNRGISRPRELGTYWDYYKTDCTVGMSIDAIAEMIAGCGHYATVDDEEKHDAVDKVNELADKIRLDEMLLNIAKCMEIFGFCPVERVSDSMNGITEMNVLDPLTMKYNRGTDGKFKGFIQEIKGEKPIQFKPEEIVWFINNEVGNAKGVKYGISRVARVLNLLEVRDQIVENINGIMKNQARPPIIWKVANEPDVQKLKAILKNCRKSDSDPVLYPKDSIEHEIVKIETRSAYWEYVSYIDSLIFEGLHAPMLNYLRNATEASANSMLEAIQRHVDGKQRYLKRMIEHEIYEFHLNLVDSSLPVPSFNWGAEKTGLEEIEIAPLIVKGIEHGLIAQNQYFAILKTLGVDVPEPEIKPEEPTMPELPNENPAVILPEEPEPEQVTQPEDKEYDYLVRRLPRNKHSH